MAKKYTLKQPQNTSFKTQKYFLIVTLLIFWAEYSSAQTFLNGIVTDGESGFPIEFVTIQVFQGEDFIAGTSSELDGTYRMVIDPGTYLVKASAIGYADLMIEDVVAYKDKLNQLDINFNEKGYDLPPAIITYEKPIIDQDPGVKGITMDAKELEALPGRTISSAVTMAPRISSIDEGEPIYISAGRAAGTVYYIDDVRVDGAGSLVPLSEIKELKVITGGISPQYGDVTGGIIAITTKSIGNKWTGGVELESSKFLDNYGQNLVNVYAGGPLVKNKKGNTLIGLRLGMQWNKKLDDRPSAIDLPILSDEARSRLFDMPVYSSGMGIQPVANLITEDDVVFSPYNPNETNERVDLSGSLITRFNENIDLTFSGSYININDQFTPGGRNLTGSNWRLLNSQNNPFDIQNRYRGNVKFRHRIGSSWKSSDEELKDKRGITFLQYNLIGGYEKVNQKLEDPTHKENFFNYGHVGSFGFNWEPTFEDGQHSDFQRTFNEYTPGNTNVGLANYNLLSDQTDYNEFLIVNGETRGGVNQIWNFHDNINSIYNNYQIRNNDRINFSANVSFDFRTKQTGGIHAIKFGFQYEELVNRGYNIAPRDLWTIGRQLTNPHLVGLDESIILETIETDTGLVNIYAPQVSIGDNSKFYQSIRDLTNKKVNEFVNLDELDPNDLNLGMFSSEELINGGNQIGLNYYGYDYEGNIVGDDVTFNDFFTAKDEDGFRTFPVAAWRPNYFGAYLMDKFKYKDIIFNIGVRIDRYDANNKVLKDPYSLYDIMPADEFHRRNGTDVPAGVGSSYKVYTVGSDSETVLGYRSGDQWYTAEGTPTNSGGQLFKGEIVFPKYYEERENNIKSPTFDINNGLTDYVPDWNILPRISFSFPISNFANFFAHYDILAQRPDAFGLNTSRVTALDYYNFESNPTLANGNLKSQKSIEYEVGFQQALGENAALVVNAFYKELRDQIQVRAYTNIAAPIGTYETYSNSDFGTAKGFSFAYNTRRIKNAQIRASYTLTFADGTGSEANSRRGLSNTGAIRTLYPLSYDERHSVRINLDYRYGAGSKYTGPRIAGKKILENTGINIQASAVSGRPYTKKSRALALQGSGTEGAINGARLPWQSLLHAKINKFFPVTDKMDGPGINVYLRVQNVLNRKNIKQVYDATGTPETDGFLASDQGSAGVNVLAEDADRLAGYLNAYNWRLLNPDLYTQARRIYLGATFQF